eukprot:TRINITY_DN46148_c0_g1_i1.p1 TRINITY_DN46148_c0_g1~~TRINITY_DN46148_c0_g1_i1.p1  ORF type:complete len:831 (+),score=244.16 TRINITY_DN46148_c0_g1_i1:156-2648(+)
MPFGVVCTFSGLFFPQFDQNWPNVVRFLLYLFFLGWVFLGVAIVSDIFMAAIEKITSAKKKILNKSTGRTITVQVWNGTMANLTLMALGSSAPEILLSCIEILSDNFFLGDLGCGTIVGSAAFNLLMISAVCVMSIPPGEVRYIKEVPVYVITATFSVLAYGWLFIMLALWTPNVCTIAEAIITFMMFPLLLILAFMADKGFFTPKSAEDKESLTKGQVIARDASKEELAQLTEQIREEHGAGLTDDQVMRIMEAQYFGTHSRAHYRHVALGKGAGGGKKANMVPSGPPDLTVTPVNTTADVKDDEQPTAVIGFKCPQHAYLENCGNAKVYIIRTGVLDCSVKVKYKTRDGSAEAGSDYTTKEGELIFTEGEEEKELLIPILDDDAHEDNEEFYVDLSDVELIEAGKSKVVATRLSEIPTVTVVIVDDDDPGVLRFVKEDLSVEEMAEDYEVEVVVERVNGASGVIGCSYYTEDDSAIAGYDYLAVSGSISFEPTVQKVTIPITIKSKGRYAREDRFRVYLHEPFGPGAAFDKETDGGADTCIMTVTIKPGTDNKAIVDKIASRINWSTMSLGHSNWKSQFREAIYLEAEDDDEELGNFDYFLHYVSLPWKLLFACTPPVDFCGGWACFFVSLIFIGFVTAIVADVANLVGCTLGITPEITAITFVALGTSLPDTFASKAAAAMDPYADASIGNVTGSNSVNVFLGLGLPWTIAAIKWSISGSSTEWLRRVNPGGPYYSIREDIKAYGVGPGVGDGTSAAFIVPAGTLWFNLVVFSCCAFVAVAFLAWRRKRYGGELGGPPMACKVGAGFLSIMWLIYVGLSSMWSVMNS